MFLFNGNTTIDERSLTASISRLLQFKIHSQQSNLQRFHVVLVRRREDGYSRLQYVQVKFSFQYFYMTICLFEGLRFLKLKP